MRLDDFGDYELRYLAIGFGAIFAERVKVYVEGGDPIPVAVCRAFADTNQAIDAMDQAREAWEKEWKSKI